MRLLERNLVPDWLDPPWHPQVARAAPPRRDMGNPEAQQKRLMDLIARLKAGPIAINTIDANQQHYEVPTEFYLNVLGPNLKYSTCWLRVARRIARGRRGAHARPHLPAGAPPGW